MSIFDLFKRKTYKDGYRQALKDAWVLKKDTIRICRAKCRYRNKINDHCILTNNSWYKCQTVKKLIRRAKV